MAAVWEWTRHTLTLFGGDKGSGSGQVLVDLTAGQSVQRIITQGQFYGSLSIQHAAPGAARIGANYSMDYRVFTQPNGAGSRTIVRRSGLATVRSDRVDQSGGLGTVNVMAWSWPWDWWLTDVEAREKMTNGGVVGVNVSYEDRSGDLPNVDQPAECWNGYLDLLVLTSSV